MENITNLASLAGIAFNKFAIDNGLVDKLPTNVPVVFDSRAFVVPSKEIAVNAIKDRMSDCIRNSVSMAARRYFSHKSLHKKSVQDRILMLNNIGVNWNDYPDYFKYGSCIKRISYNHSTAPETIRHHYDTADIDIPNTDDEQWLDVMFPEHAE